METYRIEWEIEIDADTPQEAAEKALAIQRNPDSHAVVFKVWSENGQHVTNVDLLDLEEWGTLEGAATYLAEQDRLAYLDLNRATRARYNRITLDFLEQRWKAIGDAAGLVKDLTWKQDPKFTHNCPNCVFLGRLSVMRSDRDLYFCDQNGQYGATVIARYSDEGADYTSGLGSRMYELMEAERRAKFLGLLEQPQEQATGI